MGDITIFDGLTTVSVSVWIKADGSGGKDILKKAGAGDDPIELSWAANENVSFIVRTTGNSGGTGTFVDDIQDTEWHHIVGVYNGSDVRVYVDGIIGGTIGAFSSPLATTSNNFTIGNDWLGQIAEVKIFNRALTQQEIQNEYRRNLDGNGLIAYYSFNDTNSTSNGIEDRAGNDQNGLLVGGADINAAGMWDTNALFLDGVNDYLDIFSSDKAMGISTAITETAWIKLESDFNTSARKLNYTIIDAGSHKLYLDHTSGRLTFEAVNKAQGSWTETNNDPDFNLFLAFGTYDGNLFVGTGGVAGDGDVYTFDGTDWSQSYDGAQERFNSFAVYDGNLFAGQGTGSGDGDVYTFDGTNWNITLNKGYNRALSMTVYDKNLFVGMGTGSGDRDIWTYDGTTWTENFTGGDDSVYALGQYDGNLFAGSVEDDNIYTYDGTTWSNTSFVSAANINSIDSFAVYDGNLFAGTGLDSGDGDIYTYDGTTWTIQNNLTADTISALAVYDGNLFAGTGNDAGEGDILTFDGTTWTKVYDGASNTIYDLIVYDGNLLALEGDSTNGDANILVFGDGIFVSSTTSLWNAGQWYNVGATYDGTIARIYVNGIMENTTTKSIIIDNIQDNLFSNKAFIGRAAGSSRAGGSADYLHGLIEELKLYDGALSTEQIAADYNTWMTDAVYYSPIFDAGSIAKWNTIKWLEDSDVNNSLTLDGRTCDNNSCIGGQFDNTFSGEDIEHSLTLDTNRYFQYRVNLNTNSTDWNPYRTSGTDYGSYARINNMEIDYSLNPVPDANVLQVEGNDFNTALPAFSYATDQNITITFMVSDEAQDDLNFNMWYDTTRGGKTNKIIGDINLSTDASFGNCDTNVKTSMYCSWDWNITGIADNNYWITIEINDGTDTNTAGAQRSFKIDHTAPTTVENATADQNTNWQNTDANIQFSCTDAASSCKNLHYSLDDVNYQQGWGADLNIGLIIDWDSNHEIFYWSSDLKDNSEAAKLFHLAIDKTAPTTVDNDFNTGWSNIDQNAQISCRDSLGGDKNAGCRNLYYSINDVNYQIGWGLDTNYGISTTGLADANYLVFYWSDDNTSSVGDNNGTVKLISLAIDKAAPTTRENVTADGNSSWQNTDANIQFSCSDATTGCDNLYYSLDDVNYQLGWGFDLNIGLAITTDLNHEIFFWSDDNTSDNNETAKIIYLALDKTAPTVTITDPTSGSSQTATSVTLTYTGTDTNSDINKYWVKADSGNWTDNGTNLTYTFSGQSRTAHTYYLKATDNADNNSSEASVAVTINAVASTATTVEGPGGLTGTTSLGTQPIDTSTTTGIEEILADAGLTSEQIKQALEANSKFKLERTIRVEKESTLVGTAIYKTIVTITATSLNEKTMTGIRIIENIPKGMVESQLSGAEEGRANLAEISSPQAFTVLKENQILEFIIDRLEPNGTAILAYTISNRVMETENWPAPVAAGFQELVLCQGIECQQQTCKNARCNPQTGWCNYSNQDDGTRCRQNGECEAGKCVEKPLAPQLPIPTIPATDYTTPITILGAIGLAIATGMGINYFKGKMVKPPKRKRKR